jgi:diguanylate cyclase (GGDEF)-like protein
VTQLTREIWPDNRTITDTSTTVTTRSAVSKSSFSPLIFWGSHTRVAIGRPLLVRSGMANVRRSGRRSSAPPSDYFTTTVVVVAGFFAVTVVGLISSLYPNLDELASLHVIIVFAVTWQARYWGALLAVYATLGGLVSDIALGQSSTSVASDFVVRSIVLSATVYAGLMMRTWIARGQRDTLTGLLNRRGLAEAQARLLTQRRSKAREGADVCVFLIDLDGFKRINDTLGHAAGDDVLRECAQRLRASVRPHDTVARVGGDEFTVITEGSAAHCQSILIRLEAALAREPAIRATIGVSHTPVEEEWEISELMTMADEDMYRRKSSSS